MSTAQELRQAVVDLARGEQNSRDARKYWLEVLGHAPPYPPHWCGAFTLWALRLGLGCEWRWKIGLGYLYRLRTTKTPAIGDICYMHAPYQHHALVTGFDIDAKGVSWVTTQDGNQGASPGICLEKRRKRSAWTAFYSIEPMVQAAIAAGM